MYSTIARRQVTYGLTADDVNMVRMSRTGVNLQFEGGGGDDYTLHLQVVPCTSAHEVEVVYIDTQNAALAQCQWDVDYSYPQPPLTARVFELEPKFGFARLRIEVNNQQLWWTDLPEAFLDGFESGDTSAWSSTSP